MFAVYTTTGCFQIAEGTVDVKNKQASYVDPQPIAIGSRWEESIPLERPLPTTITRAVKRSHTPSQTPSYAAKAVVRHGQRWQRMQVEPSTLKVLIFATEIFA